MPRPATAHAFKRASFVVLVMGLLANAVACRPPACDPPGGQIEASTRAQFTTWARGLTYQPRDTTTATLWGFAASDSASIQLPRGSTAPRNGTPRGCLVGRLTIARAYPAAGIGRGANYLWADSLPTGRRLVIIPEDSTVQLALQRLVLHEYPPGTKPPAMVGLLGECQRCGSPKKPFWCQSPFDSLGVPRIADPRELGPLRRGPGPM